MLPNSNHASEGTFVGRVWRPGIGPAIVTLRGDQVIDITSKTAPTMRDLLELADPVAYVAGGGALVLAVPTLRAFRS